MKTLLSMPRFWNPLLYNRIQGTPQEKVRKLTYNSAHSKDGYLFTQWQGMLLAGVDLPFRRPVHRYSGQVNR